MFLLVPRAFLLGALLVQEQSPPESAARHLRGTGFTVSWREPKLFSAETEVEVEAGPLNVWSRGLQWVRLVPKHGSFEAIRVSFLSSPPGTPDRPEVHLDRVLLPWDRSRRLLDDLGWIVSARLLEKVDPEYDGVSSDAEFWNWARVSAGGAAVFEDAYAGSPSHGEELKYGKVKAVCDRVREEIGTVVFSPCEATAEIRDWVNRKIARDYPRLGARGNLHARHRWIAAALADESVPPLFAPHALLRVRVVEEGDRPVESSRVEVVAEPRDRDLGSEGRLEAVARVGETGVRAAFLEPGEYSIEARREGYAAVSRSVRVEASRVCDQVVRVPPAPSTPESAERHLRGRTFSVGWQEPAPFPAGTEIEVDSGSLNVWSRDLDWVRLVPKNGSLEATRVRFRSTPPRAPDRPDVHLERAPLPAERAGLLLDDLAWIVAARLEAKPGPRHVFGVIDAEFWASGRVIASGAAVFEDAWGGGLDSLNELPHAKVRSVVARVMEGIDGAPFWPCEPTPEIRDWVDRKISRDYPRLPGSLRRDAGVLRARYRWIAAALGGDSVLPLFAPSALLRIRIVGDKDRPVETTRFQLVRERGIFWRTKERVEAVARLREEGVRAACLDPGPYGVEVEANGYLAQSIPVQLEASTLCDRTVRLQPDDSPK